MTTSLNIAVAIGALADDPTPIEYSRTGVAELPAVLEITDCWTDRAGTPREETNRIPARFFRRDAEFVHDRARKGTVVEVAGRLRFDPAFPGGKAVHVARFSLIDGDSR